MSATPLDAVLDAVTHGLSKPLHFWILITILAAIAGGMLIARLVMRRTQARLALLREADPAHADKDPVRFSIEGVRRLAFPLATQALLWAGEGLLRATKIIGSTADARLLRLAMTLFGAMAVIRLLVFVLRRVFRNIALISTFERVIAGTIWLVVALYVTGVLGDTVEWLESTRLPIGGSRMSLWALITGILAIVAALLVSLWAGSALEDRLMRAQSIDANVRAVLSRVLRAVLVLFGVLLALSSVGMDLTVLSVFGGALGVGLGLGLQRIASNYVAGFIILLDRSLRLGDLIAVDKYFGRVTQITTRYTVVRAGDGTEAIVPNEMLIATPVTNHTYSDKKVRLSVKVSVAYGTELAPTFAMMQAAARETARVLAEPAPHALLLGFGADGLDLEVGFWIADPEEGRLGVQSEVAQKIYKAFHDSAVEIPFPQRELHVRGAEAAVPPSAVPHPPKAA
jgi:small-conductance mechanosensitive channel